MCSECFAGPGRGATLRYAHDGGATPWRHRIAEALCLQQGVCPDSLVANTLDEEPCDGFLPFGTAAHHAWRERLREADGIIAAFATPCPSGPVGLMAAGSDIRPPAADHVMARRAASGPIAERRAPRGEIVYLADGRR